MSDPAPLSLPAMSKLDSFLTERLRLWKSEGLPAPKNELQSIQAWLRCLGENGAAETAQRMRDRMFLLMKAAGALHAAGPEAEDAAGVYDQVPRAVAQARTPTFYVASRASNLDRPRMWAEMRDKHGFDINSSWVDAAAAGRAVEYDVLWESIGEEIARCDCLVLYVAPEDFPLKGAFVEVGMALAHKKPIRIVAPELDLDTADFKPLGSWAKHRLVSFHPTVHQALAGFKL